MLAPDVAGVGDAGHLAALIDFEDGTAAAEQVARIVELHLNIIVQIEVAVVADSDEKVHTSTRIFLSVNGVHGWQTLLAAFLVEPLHIVLLNEARVGEHDAA